MQISDWLTAPKYGARFLDNNQMLDLGLRTTKFRNSSAVAKHIKKLSREFDLMLITEYFDESLLLLRKLMCWSFDDILYLKQNVRADESRSQSLSEPLKDRIRKWNVADTRLYEYFNQTLWKKIAAYGPSFRRDLQYFKDKETYLHNLCVGNATSITNTRRNLTKTRYNVVENATDHCTLMINNEKNVFKRLWVKQESVA
ncbi:galactosylceramide sulfotransferase-like [Amphiura filiformis]|uniref:galactosylceramide sulfotransferase-like n=1 Tax=Amphiura filiformis TaxID=82378 RepID=UPI003B21721C